MSRTQSMRSSSFETSAQHASSEFSPRNGRLSFSARIPIDTPHFIAVSSRGAVPHVSQDMMREQMSIKGLYVAIEDLPTGDSPLRKFIALQKDALLVLGPRRIPPLPSPASSTSTAISIVTPLGFRMLEVEDYVEGVQKLRPDIVIGMGDVLFEHKPGKKRAEIMGDRTLTWVEALASAMEEEDGTAATGAALFAPILPIDKDVQSWYLNALRDELSEKVSGLVLYEIHSIKAIPPNLQHLPKLYVGELEGPHKLLNAIALGVDLFTIPFVTKATEAGIALNFSFHSFASSNEPAKEDAEREKLGLDLWSSAYATDLSPLREGCACYTCTSHHRAYVQHLLNAREMLGWVLLQIHNHHTLDVFFENIRATLREGDFEVRKQAFIDQYQREMPVTAGQGPRVRGYTFKSEKGEPRRNPVAWSKEMGSGTEILAERVVPESGDGAEDLEGKGFDQKVE